MKNTIKKIVTNPKTPVCEKHGIEKRAKYNSSLFVCPECEKEKSQAKKDKNNELLKQAGFKSGKRSETSRKASQTSKLNKKLDDAWSKLVKLRAGMQCEYCGKTTQLNSHHVYSRAKMSLRWKPTNGICLCVGHHIGVNFSAHKTPVEFIDWLNRKRGTEFMDQLRIMASTTAKLHDFEKEIILKELLHEIEEIERNA